MGVKEYAAPRLVTCALSHSMAKLAICGSREDECRISEVAGREDECASAPKRDLPYRVARVVRGVVGCHGIFSSKRSAAHLQPGGVWAGVGGGGGGVAQGLVQLAICSRRDTNAHNT